MKLFEVCERRIDLYTYYVYAESAEAFEADDFYEVMDGRHENDCEDIHTVYIKEIEE